MGRKRRSRDPIQIRLDRLEPKHTSGLTEEGTRWSVRGAPVGALVQAQPGRKQTARRKEILEAAPDQVAPPCTVFGICGGCQLQEMPLAAQRNHKQDLVSRQVGHPSHPVEGASAAYGYRNKLELSWGSRRYLPEKRKHEPLDGSWLGFHPPGWFSRIVPLEGCPLGTPTMNQVIETVNHHGCEPPWDTLKHTGDWRHLVLRDMGTAHAPHVTATLVTSSGVDETSVRALGGKIAEIGGVDNVLWVTNDGVAEVATGDLRAVLAGEPTLQIEMGALTLRLPHDAFFQVNTEGAQVLFERIQSALLDDGAKATVADLYCGVGAIGLYLMANRPEQIQKLIGIEVHVGATRCAMENALANGIDGNWLPGKVEDVLPALKLPTSLRIVVDPPRAGLHPKVAQTLARTQADRLVYVACNPASLGRDREILESGGWSLTDLWTIDLFPQTHHVEAVARFVKPT